jgi:hypothetical protein
VHVCVVYAETQRQIEMFHFLQAILKRTLPTMLPSLLRCADEGVRLAALGLIEGTPFTRTPARVLRLSRPQRALYPCRYSARRCRQSARQSIQPLLRSRCRFRSRTSSSCRRYVHLAYIASRISTYPCVAPGSVPMRVRRLSRTQLSWHRRNSSFRSCSRPSWSIRPLPSST